ncbi:MULTISPECIES: AhpA/YtjB family protein [unclassified Idiomarina]|uniref:YtjB family periplasmic protein n=1 Tax=unclassified Idiomarina TaxID=2614829 RepID=UPI001E419936|nr:MULTISPECIES: AhpA/YtjB family protein [unclassified Idiomarina]
MRTQQNNLWQPLKSWLLKDTTRAFMHIATKRALRLGAAAGLLFIIINVWNIASVQSQQQLFNQTQSITELLMQQVEHEAHHWVEQRETDKLQQLVDYVTSQPHVLSAVIRDRFGEDMVTSGAATSIIDWPATSLKADPWILIEEINEEQHISGYIQVVFDKSTLLAQSRQAHDGLMQQGKVLLLLAMLAGVFIMLGFNRIRDRYWQK